jgi:hypothetical protein
MKLRTSIFAVPFIICSIVPSPSLASGTGPDSGNPAEVWYWCMQENIKHEVWKGRLSPKSAVAVAYRTCRPDFKAALASKTTNSEKSAFKLEAKNEHEDHIEFAIKMNQLGDPDEQANSKSAEKNRPINVWVEVTRPALSCGSVEDDKELEDQLLEIMSHPQTDGVLPTDCKILTVGDKYVLDDEQTDEDRKVVVKMWEANCTKGCSPAMSPVYAPPRGYNGAYLRPTTPPQGF